MRPPHTDHGGVHVGRNDAAFVAAARLEPDRREGHRGAEARRIYDPSLTRGEVFRGKLSPSRTMRLVPPVGVVKGV
jgi:hypothetical protein